MADGVSATYKARDVEEIIDILFYRPIGYRLALAARALRATPNAVTIVGILIGVTAGHFFYYDSLTLNALGMGLWVISNMFDSADGQLARMTGQATQLGRILDGFGGNLVFFSIYFHISLHHALSGGALGWWVFGLAIAAGACHSLQSAMADYYRNGFLRYVVRKGGAELDRSADVRARYAAARWKEGFWNKLFLRFYLNYTVEQEAFSPQFQTMRDAADRAYGGDIPDHFAAEYRRLNKPLLKYYNFLTINGRVLTLFAFVLIGYPELFFVTEITAFNVLLWLVLRRQERNNRQLAGIAGGDDRRSETEEKVNRKEKAEAFDAGSPL